MSFRVLRLVRGGRRFPNGSFPLFQDALKAKEHGERWHQQNRTSTKFVIEDEETGKEVLEAPPEYLDYDETPRPPEEDAEMRILQLEDELEKLKSKMALLAGPKEEEVDP